ncbi:hypothetical protein PHYSODRAFT_337816 [Phytophthora sojae]|uniref:Uncharacterized protein n=1 Tax=Phytophthora sojae (strain P6497) TaxID=1094619 RepID=G5A2A4_PHYSP|nr:hypothetical protein PHYSODRAFT_337816 [Phytophthora sojae]EGZ11052.1 hypothetical protein PHYSODRAFT_337816 [Phytophthora sojae]|eukprot:XP_009533797.1 hypothetical protein PHYSODRAFT_337816 [Phytophthora sojae]
MASPKKKKEPQKPRQPSSAKRPRAASSSSPKAPKRKRATAAGRELVTPDVWFSRAVADSLVMPRAPIKRPKPKPRKRKPRQRQRHREEGKGAARVKRSCVLAELKITAPLLTCMAEAPLEEVKRQKEQQQQQLSKAALQSKAASTETEQTSLMDLTFSANRAYNRFVFLSCEGLSNPAFQDAMTAVLASRTQLFRMRMEGEKTTFPVLGFRSERASSNSIAVRTTKVRGFGLVDDGGKHCSISFFGAALGKGVRMSHAVPTPENSAPLIRVRGGKHCTSRSPRTR